MKRLDTLYFFYSKIIHLREFHLECKATSLSNNNLIFNIRWPVIRSVESNFIFLLLNVTHYLFFFFKFILNETSHRAIFLISFTPREHSSLYFYLEYRAISSSK